MIDVPGNRLWNELKEGDTYPSNEKWHGHLVDQYKLYVEMADRISQRRTSANAYFLSLNSGLLAFIGYLPSKDSSAFLWCLGAAGVALSLLWGEIITSYRNLNTAKWSVVHEIEKRLPISPYDAEWEALQRGRNPKLYRPLSRIEVWVPWVFAALHAVVFVRTFPWKAVQTFALGGP
jgi:hypothetical protein